MATVSISFRYPNQQATGAGYRDLNLYKLYKLVQDQEGCRKVTDKQMWRHIMTKMGIPVPATQQPYNIHTSYNKSVQDQIFEIM